MRVIVKENRSNPELRLTFINYINHLGEQVSIPAYFDKRLPVQPEAGKEVEVMINGVLYHKDANGYYDYNRPKSFFIAEPIEGKHVKIWYNGFACSGSGCATTAIGYEMVGEKRKAEGKTLTPGRLMQSLIVADQVSDASNYEKETPGFGWAEVHPENNRRMRLVGVDDPKHLNLHIKYE